MIGSLPILVVDIELASSQGTTWELEVVGDHTPLTSTAVDVFCVVRTDILKAAFMPSIHTLFRNLFVSFVVLLDLLVVLFKSSSQYLHCRLGADWLADRDDGRIAIFTSSVGCVKLDGDVSHVSDVSEWKAQVERT